MSRILKASCDDDDDDDDCISCKIYTYSNVLLDGAGVGLYYSI